MVTSIRGTCAWAAPSNIALVKYWGKYGDQLPCNPSLSMTLSSSETQTRLSWAKSSVPGSLNFQMTFAGRKAPESFHQRVEAYLEKISSTLPLILDLDLKIETQNTFPHSAGIASSASSMASLALCLVEMEGKMVTPPPRPAQFFQRASELARLGSGSACRSGFGGYVSWGGPSEHWGTQVQEVHPTFRDWGDAILIVDSKRKAVSSRQGHALMNGHPYAESRFAFAKGQFAQLQKALAEGDTKTFCDVVESEALHLHAMMMTAESPFLLMRPETLNIVEALQEVKREWDIPLTYTLDAGPNVHLLYPLSEKERVHQLINEKLSSFCEEGKWIDDRVGEGPRQIDKDFQESARE